MHLLFLDESGRLDRGGFFALGGIAVRDTDWPALRELWQRTLRDHGWPLEREIKWHGIRKGAVPPPVARRALRRARRCALYLLRDAPRPRARPAALPAGEHDFFRSPEDVYATGLMFLAERFQHLLGAEDDLGMIVIDSRFREADARLRRFFSDLTEEGTPYMKLARIVEGLFLGPSHYSIGLQCADLVVAATAAAGRGVGDGRRYLKQLLPRFARHPATGELEGVGLKRFPEAEPRRRERNRLF
ncbi:MAG: DUF3800 domain-containing protein [Gaiellaceae bacterium]